MLVFLFLLSTAQASAYVITVYGDVSTDKDFFTRIFPWIIDNIGGEITVDYMMLGSGRYTVPQMCALQEMRLNTFLQVQYLKCEAEDHPSDYCLCETGIDAHTFKTCVNSGGSLVSAAAAKFAKLNIDVTPLIELGPSSTVFGVQDSYYLKKICTIFGDAMPRGCVKPFECNRTIDFPSKKSVSQFGKSCCYGDGKGCTEMKTTTMGYETTYPPEEPKTIYPVPVIEEDYY